MVPSMQALRLRVVRVATRRGVAVASVEAISKRTVEGVPAAKIALQVRFKCAEGAMQEDLRQRARDEALSYVVPANDVSAT
jgi:hypothetical protein